MFKDRTIDTQLALRTDRMVLETFTRFLDDLSRQRQDYLDRLYESDEFDAFMRKAHTIYDSARFSGELKQLNEGKS